MKGVLEVLPNIELSNEQLHHLLTCNKIITGGEAVICESDNPDTLYKVFWSYDRQLPMPENKIKKIELLYQMQLAHSVKPIRTISYRGMIVGYEMTTDYNFQNYKLFQLSREELIYFLNKTKEILEYFSSMGVIYGDIEPRNILFDRDNGVIEFCDMDNTQIGHYPMDKIPSDLIGYEMARGIDYGVPAFMHNIMTMGSYGLYLHCARDYAIHKIFRHPAKRIIHSMEEPRLFNGEYLITSKRYNR